MSRSGDLANPGMLALVAGVRELAERLEKTEGAGVPGRGGEWSGVSQRLRDSVLRPLEQVEPASSAETGSPVEGEPSAVLRELAQLASRLRTTVNVPLGLLEATAGLHGVLAGPGGVAEGDRSVVAALAQAQAGVSAGIRVSPNGPYLLTGVARLTDHLGVELPVTPTMALCRCGASAVKPLCDGTHVRIGFTGAKHPDRIADRLDSYSGVGLTVLDNRATCQHSGLCTDRLASVFHAESEPFVTPSGGRMDEIVAAVRSCPSGALSFAVDQREAREQVDQPRRPCIEVSKDGPYRVTGGIALTGPDGQPQPRAAGASAEHYALCRCGQSRNKPFCSGMHYYAGFADPPPPDEPTLFEWAGGLPALLAMTRIFYTKYVPADELLAPLFADMSPDHPERVAAWLAEVFGGPARYSSEYGGYSRMISQHVGKGLSEAARARWVALLTRSAIEAGLPQDAEFAAAFTAYLEWGSRIAVENSQADARPPRGMPVPRWWWVCNATPAARVSSLAPTDEQQVELRWPKDGESVSFAAHIKPLFRTMDRAAMRFVFDLWSADDVARHAGAILARLTAGSMPCDGAWSADKIALFARWIETGKGE